MYINNYRTGQDYGGNFSSYRSYGIYEGNNYGSWTNNTEYWSANLGGIPISGTFTIPYASRNGSITLYDYYWNRGHDGNGYGSAFNSTFSIDTDHSSIGDGSVTVTEPAPPRIPKAPSAPGTPSVSGVGGTSAAVSWGAPADNGGSGITNYEVQYATNSGFTTGVGTINTGGTQSGTITGLAEKTPYWVRVRASTAYGTGGYSGAATFTTLGHPNAPTGVTPTASTTVTGRVVITWTAPTSPGTGITGYVIFRDGTQIGTTTGTATTFTDTGRTPFTTYSYTVSGRNAYSDSVGSYGPQSTAGTVVAQGPPSAPQNLTGVSNGSVPGRVDLSWTAPTNTGNGGITGYKIRLADGTLLGNQNGTGTTYSVTGLNPGTAYTFKVSGRNALSDAEGSEGTFSNQVIVTPIGEPTAPTGVTAAPSATASGRIVLSWTPPPGTLSGYSIFQLIGGSYQLIAQIGQQFTTFTIDGLPVGSTNTFHVRARTAYTDTLSPGYPGNWGGPASADVSATVTTNNSQSVPNLTAATDSTNVAFNGSYVINQVTGTTVRYAKTAANVASAATGGTLTNTTNQVFNGTFVIATPSTTTLTYSKSNANIGALATTGGTVTDTDNQALNGTFTVTAVNVGANLVSYARAGADFASRAVPANVSPGQSGTITNLSNAIFNGTNKIITAITEFTISYAQTNANVAESNAAGTVVNATNRDIFNGTWTVSAVPAYNIVQYARTASNVALRTWLDPNGLVSRVTSPAILDVRFRSGWSG